MPPQSITNIEYRTFQQAYDFFNAQLFAGALPDVLVTLQRKANSRGYFHPHNFNSRASSLLAAHELALNPDTFTGRTDAQILSTLVHEMAHVWQEEHGRPHSAGYHNKEWAHKMKAIGLQPTSTGEPGGSETGQRVTHYIIENGLFADAFAQLAATGFKLAWQSAPAGKNAKAKAASKTKYACPDCGLNAWAKPGAALICADCHGDDDTPRMITFE